jgi:cystathionine beta-lyase/cystathionine gamma-synthase
MDISYIINELGEDRENYFNAIAPPIIQTSNFSIRTVEQLSKAFEDEYGSYMYSRGLNPTVDILRKKLAALDGAEDALVFNSGASAIFASVFSHVKAGDHIVSVKNPYTWAQKLFDNVLPRFGAHTTYVDGTNVGNFEAAVRDNTRVLYLETPNSWSFELQDLEAVAALAKRRNITTICDNSYCTPLWQRPLDYSIDMTVQSATKYIGGHSDVVAGVLCGRHETMKRIFNNELLNMGNAISPFGAWLLIRGLRTLPIRLQKIEDTTRKVVDWLSIHTNIERVLFPFDPSFSQYELARKQMKSAGGLFSFILKAETREQIVTFCESLHHIMMAVSWGGHESLIIPRCASVPVELFDASNSEHRMIRMYCGLEEPEYLINDLEQALAKMG